MASRRQRGGQFHKLRLGDGLVLRHAPLGLVCSFYSTNGPNFQFTTPFQLQSKALMDIITLGVLDIHNCESMKQKPKTVHSLQKYK